MADYLVTWPFEVVLFTFNTVLRNVSKNEKEKKEDIWMDSVININMLATDCSHGIPKEEMTSA